MHDDIAAKTYQMKLENASLFQLPDGASEARLKFGLENVNKHKFMYCWWTYGIKASISVCHPSTVRVAMKTSGM